MSVARILSTCLVAAILSGCSGVQPSQSQSTTDCSVGKQNHNMWCPTTSGY